jgi:hypothetical protein
VGAPPGGSLFVLWGGAQVYCTRDKLILNEIWEQDIIYILVGTLLG